MTPVVSICCLTYNHEKFISDAVQGFLMQKTDFPIEIIIHDDASTDNTANIIRDFEHKNPAKLIPIYQIENQWAKGLRPSPVFVWPKARGKYIALCEGDDYWTDPYKLQKQVDFLEANPDFFFTFHDCQILDQQTGLSQNRVGQRKIDTIVDLKSVLIQNNVPTASLVFRNKIDFNKLALWFQKTSKGDYALLVLLAEQGLGKYFPDVMSVYRIHPEGVWNSQKIDYHFHEAHKFYLMLLKYFKDSEIRRIIKKKLKRVSYGHALTLARKKSYIKSIYFLLKSIQFEKDSRLKTSIPYCFKVVFYKLFLRKTFH